MILLLAALAFADEPQTFVPQVADLTVDGTLYEGILIDEETYKELGTLRILAATQEADLQSYEEWKTDHQLLFTTSLEKAETACADGTAKLVLHYDSSLDAADARAKEAAKRSFAEKHGGPLGFALGAVTATALGVGAVYAYGRVFTVTVVQ